mmetsp:Transcript_97986/g.158025  ORF Transcript_97986/g.158025 Transcript_97986/m.158025 type:complete len:122 (+) Transcript_97986:17-382(+)
MVEQHPFHTACAKSYRLPVIFSFSGECACSLLVSKQYSSGGICSRELISPPNKHLCICLCVCVCLCACLKVELEDENIHRQAREKLSRIYVFVTKDSMRNKVGSTKTWCRVHRECVQILFS